jgi:hypothetical protein
MCNFFWRGSGSTVLGEANGPLKIAAAFPTIGAVAFYLQFKTIDETLKSAIARTDAQPLLCHFKCLLVTAKTVVALGKLYARIHKLGVKQGSSLERLGRRSKLGLFEQANTEVCVEHRVGGTDLQSRPGRMFRIGKLSLL